MEKRIVALSSNPHTVSLADRKCSLLARHERLADPNYPVINQLGLYFCRHGYFWKMEAGTLIETPQFKLLEKLFCDFARKT
jgi:hypothetical protein